MAEVLRVEHLTTWLATHSGVLTAVDDVSFSLEAGKTLALVGESGSGKSITCQSIVRLLPSNGNIAGGKVIFEGEDLLQKSPRAMRAIRGSQIGMVLQDPMTSLNPLFTIGDQIDEMFRYHAAPAGSRAQRRERTLDVLRKTQIPAPEERLGSYPHQFSGGMRQRVAIGMNIACTPKLLIADEPTTALDVTVQKQVLSLLVDIQRETGMSIILVTHDLHLVRHYCTEVAVMYSGRIVEQGPVDEVFSRPAHPYTEGLLRAVPKLDAANDRLTPISGQPPSISALPPGCRFEPRCPYALDLCRNEYPDWFVDRDARRRSACWLADQQLS